MARKPSASFSTKNWRSSFPEIGHGWPTVVLNLGVAQSGVDHKFRMLIPVYLAVHDGKIAHGQQHIAVWRRCSSKA